MLAPLGTLATRLAAIAGPALVVVVLGLFPPLPLAGVDATTPVWVAPAMAGAAAFLAAVGTVSQLSRGLSSGRRSPLIRATGFGALAVGLAVAAIRALGAIEQFPDSGLAPAAVLGAALLAAAAILREARLGGGGARTAAGIAVFLGVEAALGAGTLLAPLLAPIAPWLLAAAALFAAIAAIASWRHAAGDALGVEPGQPPDGLVPWLLAGGLAALTLARPGTVDALIGIGAIAAGALLASRPAMALVVARGPAEQETLLLDLAAPLEPPPLLIAPADGEDSLRMARELRGTIEELMRAQRTIELQRVELDRAARIDPLTGALSRRAILERLRIETGEARRYAHPLAVILLDVDDFGEVNREHGLAAGDAALKELALRLRLRSRAADALGRIGGDSFVAVLPHTDERGAAVFADALRRRASSRPILTESGELRLTVSIGVAFVRPGMELSDEGVLTAAEEALASARAAGGNRIAFDRAHGLIRLDDRREREPGA